MRIVHVVCSSGFAGVERSVASVAPELACRGHEVTVLGGDPVAMRAELRDTEVTFLPAPTTPAAARELVGWSFPRPDVVHSHMTAADLAAVASWPVVRAPLVSTLHFAQPRGRDPVRRTLYRALPPCFRAQVAVSRFVADTCGTPTVVVPNGVPDPGPVDPVASRDPVVLVAQRLEQEKRTSLALEAWAASGLASDGWRLAVAGRGSGLSALGAHAHRLGVEDSVDFLGFVDDLRDRMRRASVFLATAPGEPFGLSVVEALANGLPVLAADGGAHREVLAGFPEQLFPVDDAHACANALRHLASDTAVRTTFAERGRCRYQDRYTIGRQVDGLLDVYSRVR